MWDWLRARKEGRKSSGNGRRQSYQHLPMVRMTNTYLLAGKEDPDEIVAQTPHGVYVEKLGGGQVNTATGDFVFGTTEAYLIEDGRITEPLRDANLIGNGPDVLRRIDAVATDFDMTPGTCGKDGQSVPVGCGQATLRITGVTLGRHGMTPRAPPSDGELLDLANEVVARAGKGEGLEVYVARGTDSEIRAYEGEVESLTSADSSGVGIRVLVDDAEGTRVGFAWAGSLDPDVIAATLADARDNARFATPDPDMVLASPTASPPPSSTCGTRRHLHPHGAEGGAGHRARARHPGRRSPGPPGVFGRLLRQSRRGRARLHHRHLVVPEAHHGFPRCRRHRGRSRGHPDR